MKLEHKIGIAVTCTFLCLTGAVIGLKWQEQATPKAKSVADAMPDEPVPGKHGISSHSSSNQVTGNKGQNDHPPLQPLVNSARRNGGEVVNPSERASENLMAVSLLQNKQTPSGPRPLAPQPSSPTPNLLGANKPTTDKVKLPTTTSDTMRAMLDRNIKQFQEKSSPSTSPLLDAKTVRERDKKLTNIGGTTPDSPIMEPTPVAPPVSGAGEWDPTPRGAAGNNQSARPAERLNTVNAGSPPKPPQFSPQVNKDKDMQASLSTNPILITTSATDAPKNATSPPPSPSPVIMPPSSPTQKNPPSSPPPAPAFPVFLAEPSANSPKPLNPLAKEQTPPLSAPSPVKPAQTPNLVPNPTTPPPSPTTPVPTPKPNATPPSISSSPPPVIVPEATSPAAPLVTPVPVPLPPPKPPAEGSTFIPDRSPPAPTGGNTTSPSSSGPVSIKPEPFPLPTPPPSASPGLGTDRLTPSASALAPPPAPASKGPSVMAYDELEYTCQRGDTWEEISKRYYQGSDRYAKALQQHNQNHARARDQMMRTGQLAEGQPIYIPQAYVLEQKYAGAIPPKAATPASTPTMMPAGFVDKGGAPPPVPPANVPVPQYRNP